MQNDRESSETVILGVDTHLDVHVGAVISQAGKLPGTHIIQTNQAGYLELLDWARSFGILERAGIEGTGTYGAALTRYLIKMAFMLLKLTGQIAQNAALKGSQIHWMQKMQPGQCFQGAARPYQKCSQVRVKLSGLLVLPDAVQ